MKPKNIAMLGSGFIIDFYTACLANSRSMDKVKLVFSRSEDRARRFAEKWSVPNWTTSMEKAVNHPDIDTVVIGLSNDLHLEAALLSAAAGKAVLCTKPLGRNSREAKKMLEAVEEAGVFHGYLEDLVYTHKTLKALEIVNNGALGEIFWVRSRETHPGPHSDWFWTPEISGGGVIVDMGCHCIEIARNLSNLSRSCVGLILRSILLKLKITVLDWSNMPMAPSDNLRLAGRSGEEWIFGMRSAVWKEPSG